MSIRPPTSGSSKAVPLTELYPVITFLPIFCLILQSQRLPSGKKTGKFWRTVFRKGGVLDQVTATKPYFSVRVYLFFDTVHSVGLLG
eukprot:g20942.t1